MTGDTTATDATTRASRRRSTRWAVPVVVAAGVVAAFTVNLPSSDAVPQLPHRSPAQLIAAVQRSSATAFSGQLQQTSDLGLPTLPGAMAGGTTSSASLSWQGLLTGSHTAKVWVDGPTKQRLAVLGDLSEADVVHNGKDLWTYTSATNTVTHAAVPADQRTEHTGANLTPEAVAARVLAAVDPTTTLTVGTAQRVADRSAYTLIVTPRDTRSTVHAVKIAVDAATYLPLRLQVFGAGSSPAFSIGFTDISFDRPAASEFAFHTPAGATVSDRPFTSDSRRGSTHFDGGRHREVTYHGRYTGDGHTQASGDDARPSVIGTGWTAMVELHSGLGAANGMVRDATTPIGTSGARLLHTALVNAVLMPDGRVFAGAVTPTLLEHVATTH